MKRKIIDNELIKFLLVGVINTIVGTGSMFLFYNVFHFSYWISSASNYVLGGTCSYFLNKYFTFKDNKKSFIQILVFIVNLVVCYYIAYFFSKVLIYRIISSYSEAVKDNVAMLTGEVLYTIINFLGQKLLVFKKGEKNWLN